MGGLRADLQLEEEILFGLRPKPTPIKAPPGPKPSETTIRPGLSGLGECAKREPQKKFAALMHYVDMDLLKSAYRWLQEEGVRGGGGRTWKEYGVNLHANTVRLYTRVQRGTHRTLPSWRRAVAVAQGRRRLLKRAALKDRIVQRATAAVLESIYQPEFVEFACGFRSSRSGSGAFERIAVQVPQANFRWVVEADIEELRSSVDNRRLLRFLQQRIGDVRILELIRKWLQAGVLEEIKSSQQGGPPRQAIGTVLADVYYHYCLDSWVARWRQRHARSTATIARDLTILIAVFEHKPSARRFHSDLRVHLKQHLPSLQTRNLRLLSFARFARERLGEPTLAGRAALEATNRQSAYGVRSS